MVDIEQKLQFSVTPQFTAAAPCTVSITGPCEVKADVEPGAGSYTVSYSLPQPGVYTVSVSLAKGGPVTTFTVRSAPVIVVADYGSDQLFVFRLNGDLIRKIGSQGARDGQFQDPKQVAVSADYLLFVSDYGNHRVQVLRWDGMFVRSIRTEGVCTGVALDSAGLVYASDYDNDVIRVFTQNGTRVRICRFTGPGVSAVGALSKPLRLSIDRGLLYVANCLNSRIEIFNCANGEATAHFDVGDSVYGVCVDEKGLVYTSMGAEVRVWSGSGDKRSCIRTTTTEAWNPLGLFIHAGLLYVANNYTPAVCVFNASDGSLVRAFGVGVVNGAFGVTVVPSPTRCNRSF